LDSLVNCQLHGVSDSYFTPKIDNFPAVPWREHVKFNVRFVPDQHALRQSADRHLIKTEINLLLPSPTAMTCLLILILRSFMKSLKISNGRQNPQIKGQTTQRPRKNGQKEQGLIYKTLHRQQKIKQHEPHLTRK